MNMLEEQVSGERDTDLIRSRISGWKTVGIIIGGMLPRTTSTRGIFMPLDGMSTQHRWELPGNYPCFKKKVIYLSVWRIMQYSRYL